MQVSVGSWPERGNVDESRQLVAVPMSMSRSPPGRRSVRLSNACRLGGGIVARQSDMPKARRSFVPWGRDVTPRVHALERWSPGGAGGGSRCGAAAQVGHALQAQTLGDVAETLTRGGEEAARETPLAQRLEPGIPLIGTAAEAVEDFGHRARQRGLPHPDRAAPCSRPATGSCPGRTLRSFPHALSQAGADPRSGKASVSPPDPTTTPSPTRCRFARLSGPRLDPVP